MLKKCKITKKSSKTKEKNNDIKKLIFSKNELNNISLDLFKLIQLMLLNKLKGKNDKIILIKKNRINWKIKKLTIIILLKNFLFYILINPILTVKLFNKIKYLNSNQIINLKAIKGTKVKIINSKFIPNKLYINGVISNFESSTYVNINNREINDITLEWVEKKTNYDKIFQDINGVIEIDLSKFDTSGVTSMKAMFINCQKLVNIDLTNVNTASVTNMTSMFENCTSLISLNLSNFDVSKVLYTDKMFKNCNSLTSLNLSNFKTPNLKKMEEMFSGCSSLQNLDISNFNTIKISNMGSLFYLCKQLTSLNIMNFNTQKVKNMNEMFKNCESLISIDLTNMDTSIVTNMNNMFYECKSLTSLDLSHFITSKVVEMSYMFTNCTNLTFLDISHFETSKVVKMEYMFKNCESLLSIDLSNFELSNQNLESFFCHCYSLTSIKFSEKKNLLLYNISFMFKDCRSLESLDISNLNLSLITSMQSSFYGCSSLKSLDLSKLETNSLTNTQNMFSFCESLETINFTNFNTSLVTNFSYMFYGCTSLKSLDLSSFNTSFVNDMSYLFSNCYNIKELKLTSFNTSLVNNMDSMFSDCNSLTSIDLSSFNTSKVIIMSNMFKNCIGLISLDLSNFNIQKGIELNNMFYGCSDLKYINFYNFNGEESKVRDIFYKTSKNLILCVNEKFSKYIIPELSFEQCQINNCSLYLELNKRKIIYDKRKCLDQCQSDEIYKYEFDDYCYDKCPERTYSKKDNIYHCQKEIYECFDDYPFLIIKDYTCSEECNSKDFFENICTINNNITQSQSILITNIINGIENGLMDELLLNSLNEGKDLIKIEYNTSYQITSSFNQNNKVYENLTVIKLCECENILKEKYNISKNEYLIIFKTERKLKGLLIPLIEYVIFNSNTKEKLDLNYCKNNNLNITMNIPATINENFLFRYEQNNIYYNDICTTYNIITKADITMYDRKSYFNNNNLNLCPKNCTYNGYNLENKTVICHCQVQDRFLFSDINNDDLLFKFIIIKRITNFNILKCYKLLFFQNGLINNIGSYIILLVIFIYVISGIYFYKKEFILIYEKIKDILYNKIIENNESNIPKNQLKDEIKEKKTDLFSSKKNKISSTSKNLNQLNKENKLSYSNNSEFRNIINNKSIKKTEYKELDKSRSSFEYEINFIPYKEALIKDKRKYFQLYISLLKERHVLISIFNKDSNSFIIKLCLLCFSFVLNIIINELFFNDDLMHRIYIDNGIYKFKYNIHNIIYSTIIVAIIISIKQRLFFTNNIIIEMIHEKNQSKLESMILIIMKRLIIKFVCFFMFGILFLILFWYYLSCFCAVYKNTQIYLIKNSLISFSIILIYPFIICLFPGIFRIPAINGPGECLYKISQIIQFI